MLQFKRAASLIIGQDTEGLLVSDLRLSFKVVKTLDGEKNTATIKVYNLSEATRSKLEEPGVTIILKAGYGDQTEILAYGDLYEFKTVTEKPDRYTELTIKDGGKALDSTTMFETFGAGTTVDQVIGEVTNALGLAVKQVATGFTDQFANGFTIAGPVKDTMESLGKSFGFDFSIQDGEIQVLEVGAVNNDERILVNEETGMINAPHKIIGDDSTPAGTNDDVSRLKVVTLLNPKYRPGTQIELDSKEIYGIYKINKVTHKGDTRGADWFSEIEVSIVE